MAKLFDNLMPKRRVENVLLDRNVFVIQLVHQTERRDIGGSVAKTCLAELIRDLTQSLDVLNSCTL